MRTGSPHGLRYSPGNMDRQSLEALFVGRDDLMEDVLSRVTKSVLGTGKHYVLLVGPRGSGKTHFLALAHYRLMDRLRTADAHERVAVALLKEDEWGVASFLDFVVRILRALADQAPELDAEIATVCDMFAKDPAEAEAIALARLRQHIRGKTLLLICENLADLFAGLGEEGQKRWRSAIQEDGNWTIVASTPSLFSTVTSQDSPFYGFFTIRALEKIDFDASLDLLVKKAVRERKDDLAGTLRTPFGRARARAIHHLAAGNHQTYVVLFDYLDNENLDDLVQPFTRMVDDLTPYYQDRMRQLPPAKRKIIEFLCLEGRPKTIKDISTPCLMSQQTAAKQIGELDAAGLVSRTRFGRNTYCEISEPLMRICFEIKSDKAEYFRLFVEFLCHWFAKHELEDVPDLGDQGARVERTRRNVDESTLEKADRAAAQAMLGTDIDFKGFGRDAEHLAATVGALAVAVRSFGPRCLPQGLAAIREALADRLDEGTVGRVLTGFLRAGWRNGFAGDLADWEQALQSLATSLYGLPCCRIPIGMLQAAVRHAKTGDERHLLSLPLEQRQLLKDEPPPTSDKRT